MLVYCKIAYISLLLENDRNFAKITKNIVFGRKSSFFDFLEKLKKTTPDFFDENGFGLEFGQPQ